jgi:isoamyl acetate esterase
MQHGHLRRVALMVGDSITQYGYAEKCLPPGSGYATPAFPEGIGAGWTGLVADHYARKVDVINRGLSGYNTRKACAVLPRILDEYADGSLLFATLLLGTNDSVPDEDDELCSHVPLEEYEANLKRMASSLMLKASRVCLLSPPSVDEAGSALGGRQNATTSAYAAVCKRVAEGLGLLFVDTFVAMRERDDANEMLFDGVHLSAKGNAFVASLVLQKLEADPTLASGALPWDLPGWRDLDRFNPQLR